MSEDIIALIATDLSSCDTSLLMLRLLLQNMKRVVFDVVAIEQTSLITVRTCQ